MKEWGWLEREKYTWNGRDSRLRCIRAGLWTVGYRDVTDADDYRPSVRVYRRMATLPGTAS